MPKSNNTEVENISNGVKTFISLALAFIVLTLPVNVHAEKSQYKLQPLDVITITVHQQPDLNTKTRVAADGSISFPLIGKIAAAGLTVQQLEQKIKELLEKDYLVKAEVLVGHLHDRRESGDRVDLAHPPPAPGPAPARNTPSPRSRRGCSPRG